MLQLSQEIMYAHIVLNCMSSSALGLLSFTTSCQWHACHLLQRVFFIALKTLSGRCACCRRRALPAHMRAGTRRMQQTLLCLSKLYRCVEGRVFAGLGPGCCVLLHQSCPGAPALPDNPSWVPVSLTCNQSKDRMKGHNVRLGCSMLIFASAMLGTFILSAWPGSD